MVKEHEGRPAQEHKDNDHPVEIGAVVISYAGVFRGKSRCRNGSECSAQGIKEAHPSET